jgi:NAD+ synthase (glutamine-hydrolysing)
MNLKIAQASLNQTGLDWPTNITHHCMAIEEAVKDGADLLCLPELSLTGYDNQDNSREFDNTSTHEALQFLANYAASLNPNLILSIGHPWRLREDTCMNDPFNNPIYNTQNKPFIVQSFVSGGKLFAMHPKRYAYDYARGYEGRYFTQWHDRYANEYNGSLGSGYDGCIPIMLPAIDALNSEKTMIPFGSAVVQLGEGSDAILMTTVICEEYWKGTWLDHTLQDNALLMSHGLLAEKLSRFDIALVINPNASPPAIGKYHDHLALCKKHSEYCGVIVHTDELGSSGGTYASYGQCIIAQNGTLISQAPRARFCAITYSSQVVTIPPMRSSSNKPHAIIPHRFTNTHTSGLNNQPASWDFPDNPYLSLEESIRIECLWLFDYMVKNKIRGFTQALSGGADSAYNAAKIRIMLYLAINDLGIEKTLAKLPYSTHYAASALEAWLTDPAPNREAAIDVIMNNILTCITMPTQNNSDETMHAARSLIQGGVKTNGTPFKGIGGQFYECNIESLITLYAKIYAGINPDELTPERDHELSLIIKNILYLNSKTLTPTELEQIICDSRQLVKEITHSAPLSLARASDQLAYENLQARIRSTLIWIFSNTEQKVGIANPNLDEICNGYTSFSGDEHAGSIGGNAHKHKVDQLREMRQLMERGLNKHNNGIYDVPPIEAFYPILEQKPSAELQPKNEAGEVTQYDETSLERTYEQIKFLTHAMLHDESTHYGIRNTPIEVFELCRHHTAFISDTIEQLHDKVRATYTCWASAQFKIHASAIAYTGADSVDHQVSQRTPTIAAYRKPELALLALHCLNELVQKEGSTFEQLTGQSLKHCQLKIRIDHSLITAIEAKLWDPVEKKMRLTALWQCLKTNPLKEWSGMDPIAQDRFIKAIEYQS